MCNFYGLGEQMGNSFVEEDKKLSDKEIISEILSGRYEYFSILIDRYMPTVILSARSFENCGVDIDELISEGTLAVFSAVRTYNSELSSFGTFAGLCIKRAMLSQIRSASAKKRIPEDLITPIDDVVLENPETPEDIYIKKESYDILKENVFSGLSMLECSVLTLFLDGVAYSEIAHKLKIPVKSVDNAMTRIRNKVKNNK